MKTAEEYAKEFLLADGEEAIFVIQEAMNASYLAGYLYGYENAEADIAELYSAGSSDLGVASGAQTD